MNLPTDLLNIVKDYVKPIPSIMTLWFKLIKDESIIETHIAFEHYDEFVRVTAHVTKDDQPHIDDTFLISQNLLLEYILEQINDYEIDQKLYQNDFLCSFTHGRVNNWEAKLSDNGQCVITTNITPNKYNKVGYNISLFNNLYF